MKNRKSKSMKVAGLIGLAALFLASCHDEHYRHCVDNTGKVMPDSLCNCRDENNNYHGGYGAGGMGGMGYMPFLWYYGSRNYGYGEQVSGGHYSPSAGVSYSSPGTSRGGFGSSSKGGGEGGGGHSGGGAGE